MEFIKPGTYIDFMKYRTACVVVSSVLVIASLVSLFWPGPNYGIDFSGGTEIQLRFNGDISAAELRQALEDIGYHNADVISVAERPNEYILRVEATSSMTEADLEGLETKLKAAVTVGELRSFRASPGGDKIVLTFDASHDPSQVEAWLTEAGAHVRAVNSLGPVDDYRYEAHLVGLGDEIVQQLGAKIGERAPDAPLRVEWVGPRAGQQLRDAAIEALVYSIAFIMLYVAFRFDLRFAPGSIVALMHDVILTMGVYVLVQKEVSLTTVAALLTILGFSINDTIVIYDRIRENMGRAKGETLSEIINTSTSQVLSRSIITNGTTLVSVTAFLIWGTPVIQDLAFALVIGIAVGTYSSIYIAAPVTEWVDRRFFQKKKGAKVAKTAA